jgi:hypothetical protein
MSITLSKVEYTYFGSITSEFADFLDSVASDVTPTRMHLSKDDNYRIERLKSYARSQTETIKIKNSGDSSRRDARLRKNAHVGESS